jgi:hypothetical protein
LVTNINQLSKEVVARIGPQQRKISNAVGESLNFTYRHRER